MKLRIIEHKTYDSENYLTRNYFTVQYHTKLLGIIPMWITLKKPTCDGMEARTFSTQARAKAHIEELCKEKRLRFDRNDKNVVETFNCTNL
jgi:hypothetical protein